MSSPSQSESITVNQFQSEFNELAVDLSTAFDTTSHLLVQMEQKLDNFNAFIDRKIASNFAENEFADYIAENPHWRLLRDSIQDDEVKLRMKIRSLSALISNEAVDKETNQDGATSDDINNAKAGANTNWTKGKSKQFVCKKQSSNIYFHRISNPTAL